MLGDVGIKKLKRRNKERIKLFNLFHKEQSFEKFLQKREELLTYELHLVHQSHARLSLVLLVVILHSKYERSTLSKMNNNFYRT